MKGRYGGPRMAAELEARGRAGSESAVAQLMRGHGSRARAPRRFARATGSTHRLPVAANAPGRAFGPAGPSARRCADVTSLPTREGWLHVAAVEDPFRRPVVGGPMGGSMGSRLAVDALGMATGGGGPEPACWRTRIAGASTPAATTGGCRRAGGSCAA